MFGKFIYKLTTTKIQIEQITKRVVELFAKDNCKYLELRTTPRETSTMSKKEYIEGLLDGIRDSPISVRLLISMDRRHTAHESLKVLEIVKEINNPLIVGVDLCGDPAKGDFITDMKPALLYAKEIGLKVTTHLSELPNVDQETWDILQTRPDRVGHCIYLDEKSTKFIKENKIPIEICLSSNICCKAVNSIEEHHVKEFIDHPIALCTDDIGVFKSTLTQEYEMVENGLGLSKQDLFNLSLRSIDCIFDEAMKPVLKKQWLEFSNQEFENK
ncbi:hypothetical protein HK103_001821 [Boothiomyces macroporosus]|uniref:Adenosine deaminase domain-containing protein n=1 Tax=Boothiomyces macroporosus TaxID=261099 RepID=A0AAD5Y4P9_9FUNG|nr:hypothetical protein HK103_001821 [Boothiomyces macroporosus]